MSFDKDIDMADNAARVVTPSDVADDSSSTYSVAAARNLQQSTQPSVQCTTPQSPHAISPASQKQLPSPPPEPEATSMPSRSPSKRIAKSFSFRTRSRSTGSGSPTNRLRKKSLSEDSPPCGAAMVPGHAKPPGPTRSVSANQSPVLQQTFDFAPLAISIPTESLLEDDFMSNVSFSKRGSLMFGGKRALAGETGMDDDDVHGLKDDGAADDDLVGSPDCDATKIPADGGEGVSPPEISPKAHPPPSIRVLSDIAKESQKVRSFYEVGDTIVDWEKGGPDAEASSSSLAGEGLSHPPEEASSSLERNEEHDPYEFLETFFPEGVLLKPVVC